MLLLTGATGRVGSALLERLVARREPVRCLVRDPRRLGPDRVRVQIALGDLGDPASFRHALRGVTTVVHLAAAERDQIGATIEEVTGVATWRLLRAAEAAGAQRFVFLSPLGAVAHHRARLHRAKALAERAVAASSLETTIVRSSLIYERGDRRLSLLEKLSLLPAVPVTRTMAAARSQPVWAGDVAACLDALLERPEAEVELAGPEEMTHRAMLEHALEAYGRPRRLVVLPSALVRLGLNAYQSLAEPVAFTSRDETDLLASTMLTERGTADAERLGVTPRRLVDVLSPA